MPTVSLSKGNEALATFVPKHKAHALEALKQCKLAHTAKFGIVTEHQGQAVIRNTADKWWTWTPALIAGQLGV